MSSTLPIPLDWLPRFSAATRNEILAAIATNGQVLGQAPKPPPTPPSPDEPSSYPLNHRQAGKLIPGINSGTAAVLKRIAENFDPATGRGRIDWPEAKALSGAKDYAHFAQGHRSGLTRRLRKMTGEPDAELLIEENDWVWPDGVSDYTAGTFFVDGPAVVALRAHFGL